MIRKRTAIWLAGVPDDLSEAIFSATRLASDTSSLASWNPIAAPVGRWATRSTPLLVVPSSNRLAAVTTSGVER